MASGGRSGGVALVVAVTGGIVIGGALFGLDRAGVLRFGPRAASEATPTPTTSAAPSEAPGAAARAEEAAPADAAADTSATPATGSQPPDRDTCLLRFFPDDTFEGSPPDLAFVCEEPDVIRAVSDLKVKLVEAGRGRPATGGMTEWAVMGMYDLASFAVIRGRCCPGARTTVLESPATCEPLVDALDGLSRASARGAPAADLEPAVDRFDGAARCIMRFRQTAKYGGYKPLLGGEASTFRQIAARLSR